MKPNIPSPATAAPIASGRAPAAFVPVGAALEPVTLAALVAGEVRADVSVVLCPSASVVVNCVTCDAKADALLVAAEPRSSPSEAMELPALAAAEPTDAASPVSEAMASLPPVLTAFPMEVASAPASEAKSFAAATMESSFWLSWAVAVARRRAVVRRVNFILVVAVVVGRNWEVDEL